MTQNKNLTLLFLRDLSVNLARCEAPVDLFVDAVLIASSVVLCCYWFRYGCLLILAADIPRDYSEVATANRLSFPEVRPMLRRPDVTDLGSLHKCLEQDFTVIICLLEHTSMDGFDTGFEDAMLKFHYRAMSLWFRLTHGAFREFASGALEEMWLVVAHFANALGNRRATAR